jgi:hypothetical protein
MEPSYDPLFKLATGTDDVKSVYKTGRGSTYAHHGDSTSTRNRSGKNHQDTTTGIQPRSGKTIYIDRAGVTNIAGLYQNPNIGTRLVPETDSDGRHTNRINQVVTHQFGPKAPGTVMNSVAYSLSPQVGLHPVEIFGGSESPKGSSGSNVHFGNEITEVHHIPKAAGTAGKLGIGAALVGAAGSANAGEYRKAAGEVTEAFMPPWLYSGGLNEGEDEQVAAMNRKASGGPVTMPASYSEGRWRLI